MRKEILTLLLLVCSASAVYYPDTSGDVDLNKIINLNDVIAMGPSYGTTAGDLAFNPNADFNGDGKVGLFDLATIGKNWMRQYD